jgi:hypothetical protein
MRMHKCATCQDTEFGCRNNARSPAGTARTPDNQHNIISHGIRHGNPGIGYRNSGVGLHSPGCKRHL